MAPAILLITGSPGSGKTTLLLRLLEEIRPAHATGFYTREVRSAGIRTGFELVSLDGRTAILASVGGSGPHRVGKYRVNVAGFEDFLAEIPPPDTRDGPVVIDEIGKMEALSPRFRDFVTRIIDAGLPLVATIAQKGDGFIGSLRERPGSVLITVARENREEAFAAALGEARRLGLGSP